MQNEVQLPGGLCEAVDGPILSEMDAFKFESYILCSIGIREFYPALSCDIKTTCIRGSSVFRNVHESLPPSRWFSTSFSR